METLTPTNAHVLLTVREVAARLRWHPMTVRRAIRDGRLRALQLGGPGHSLRIDAADLDALLHAPPERTP